MWFIVSVVSLSCRASSCLSRFSHDDGFLTYSMAKKVQLQLIAARIRSSVGDAAWLFLPYYRYNVCVLCVSFNSPDRSPPKGIYFILYEISLRYYVLVLWIPIARFFSNLYLAGNLHSSSHGPGS